MSTTCSSHNNLHSKDSNQDLNDQSSEMQEVIADPSAVLGQGRSAFQSEEGSRQAPQDLSQRISQSSWIQSLGLRFIPGNIQLRPKQLNYIFIFSCILMAVFISMSFIIQEYSDLTGVEKSEVTNQLYSDPDNSSWLIDNLNKELEGLDQV